MGGMAEAGYTSVLAARLNDGKAVRMLCLQTKGLGDTYDGRSWFMDCR